MKLQAADLAAPAVTAVDHEKKIIKTEFEQYSFDDASIYPNIRASTMIEQLGLVDPTSLQKEANIDVRFYNIKGDPHVYVTGDARNHPYSKSANTSNTEGQFVAKVLAGGTDTGLLALLKRHFTTVKHAKPPASRKGSSEWYVIAQGFKARAEAGADEDGED